MATKVHTIPAAFAWRRIHSLLGLLIVLFLTEHLITNSQAALWVGDDGIGFIRAVNLIHHLPYLQVIEVSLIGIPILFHAAWGIRYAMTGRINSASSDGSKPALPRFARNHAYTWQRITSYILLVGIAAHVWYMRFHRYPYECLVGDHRTFFNWVSTDPGLYPVAKRLDVKIYTPAMVAQEKTKPDTNKAWLAGLTYHSLTKNEVMIEANNFGTATLLMIRDAFKSPFKAMLYTLFVLAATFHGFNGLWTFMISWGMILSMRSQNTMVKFCVGLMFLIGFLGLVAVWGTYWINLRH